VRTITFVLALLTFSALAADGQPVTIHIGPVGGSAPFGEAYSGAGLGGAWELSARYHMGAWSAGLGFHGSDYGDADFIGGPDFEVGALFVEGRYGDEFSGRSLRAGDRFYPYASLRLGYAYLDRPVAAFQVVRPEGPEIQPAIGFQQWLSRDVGIDVSSGVRLAEFDGDFGGSAVLQTGLVVGL
jgi:hypothetical protein